MGYCGAYGTVHAQNFCALQSLQTCMLSPYRGVSVLISYILIITSHIDFDFAYNDRRIRSSKFIIGGCVGSNN